MAERRECDVCGQTVRVLASGKLADHRALEPYRAAVDPHRHRRLCPTSASAAGQRLSREGRRG